MNLPWVKRKQERLDALAVAAARCATRAAS